MTSLRTTTRLSLMKGKSYPEGLPLDLTSWPPGPTWKRYSKATKWTTTKSSTHNNKGPLFHQKEMKIKKYPLRTLSVP